MLDKLRIKCPSCGIILEVSNSRHEALKQIACPNCKRQLAVNFEEEIGPSAPPQAIEPLYYGEMRIDLTEGVNKISLPYCDKAEIKVVRLKDGNTKRMIRPLTDSISVKVNGQQLNTDEQVVLSKGDLIEIGKTVVRAGEPGDMVRKPVVKPKVEKPKTPMPQKKGTKMVWVYSALAFVVLLGATVALWPKKTGDKQVQEQNPLTPLVDTTKTKERIETDIHKEPSVKEVHNRKTEKEVPKHPKEEPAVPSGSLDDMSDFDLEKKALGGSVDAQYVLGARLIKRGGINNSVRGIKYLKLAANNGSSRARTGLAKIVSSLQDRANRGDSISYYILKSI